MDWLIWFFPICVYFHRSDVQFQQAKRIWRVETGALLGWPATTAMVKIYVVNDALKNEIYVGFLRFITNLFQVTWLEVQFIWQVHQLQSVNPAKTMHTQDFANEKWNFRSVNEFGFKWERTARLAPNDQEFLNSFVINLHLNLFDFWESKNKWKFHQEFKTNGDLKFPFYLIRMISFVFMWDTFDRVLNRFRSISWLNLK